MSRSDFEGSTPPAPLAYRFEAIGTQISEKCELCNVHINGLHRGWLAYGPAAIRPETVPNINLSVFDRFNQHVYEDFVSVEQDWRVLGANVLAWREHLLATRWGGWYTDSLAGDPQPRDIHWREVHHTSIALAGWRHVLVPDHRLSSGQMITLMIWLHEHAADAWTIHGSTLAFRSSTALTVFILHWQAVMILATTLA